MKEALARIRWGGKPRTGQTQIERSSSSLGLSVFNHGDCNDSNGVRRLAVETGTFSTCGEKYDYSSARVRRRTHNHFAGGLRLLRLLRLVEETDRRGNMKREIDSPSQIRPLPQTVSLMFLVSHSFHAGCVQKHPFHPICLVLLIHCFPILAIYSIVI